jgi:hypothetical protein
MPITAAPFDDAGFFRALRATSTIRPVPRGLPLLFALPGMAATPWLFSRLGRMLLGVLLSRHEPWSQRLGLLHARGGRSRRWPGTSAPHASPSARHGKADSLQVFFWPCLLRRLLQTSHATAEPHRALERSLLDTCTFVHLQSLVRHSVTNPYDPGLFLEQETYA